MPLTPGTRLGSYEVVAPLGAGGMGEVYRARDTKLDRDVAIKVLPSHLSNDTEALARFEREAKAVAALSHPNILAIHDFGRDAGSGTAYAVMELLEGATLRQRLKEGALPLKKTVQIGVDLAHGLAAAHGRGLVHRDLKPENIFVTSDGRIKILDFGLARLTQGSEVGRGSKAAGAAEGREDPTHLANTTPGTVLGTVGYMAPEQVRGQAVDHRADVFALGAVLYEMATGRRAFARETAAETMTAILREDPLDPAPSRQGSPPPAVLEPIIRHCLEKQQDERFQSASDLAFALQSISSSSAPATSGPQAVGATSVRVQRRIPLGLIAAAALLAAAAFVAGRYWAASSGTNAGTMHVLNLQQITDDAGVETEPSLSPDGGSIAFTRLSGRRSDVFVQRVGGRAPIPIAVDPELPEGGPAFSPDGASVAFHLASGRGGIFVVGATGESARRVSEFGYHPAWSPDGQKLVFCTERITTPLSRSSTSELWTVDVKGGVAPVKLVTKDAVQPAWSPNNKRIAYWGTETGQRDMFTVPVTGGDAVAVTNDAAIDWGPKWSSDGRYLYFSSDRGGAMNIWRVAIDESTGQPRGEPEPITQGVTSSEQVSLSRDGARLAFRSSSVSSNPAAIPFDEAGERLGAPKALFDRSGNLSPSSASPDGKWLAYWNIGELQEDVFISHPDGTGLRRLTDDMFRDRFGAWSPDSTELAFYSNRSGVYNIHAVRPDGSGLRSITERPGGNDANLLYPVFSPTGDRLVASRIRADDSILLDPRKPWSSQTPEKLPMAIADLGWMVPNQWSPDGARLLGPILNTSGAPIATGVYDFASRKARLVEKAQVIVQGYAWLSDSRRVIYILGNDLVLVDVDSGRRKVLPTGVQLGFGLALGHDRRTVYVSIVREQADIWIGETKK